MLKQIVSLSFAVFLSVAGCLNLATAQDMLAIGQVEYSDQTDTVIVGQSNAVLDHNSISLVEFVDDFGNIDYGAIEIEDDGTFMIVVPSRVAQEPNTFIVAAMVDEVGGSDSVVQLFLFVLEDKMTLPEDPDDLDDDWEEQTDQGPSRRTFKHKTKGITIHFDKGVEGENGWKGKDHWHIRNPNWKEPDKRKGFYVDKDGNPVNDGSNASHIKPGTEVVLPKKAESNETE